MHVFRRFTSLFEAISSVVCQNIKHLTTDVIRDSDFAHDYCRHFNLEKAKTKYGKTVQNRRKMCEIKQAPIDLPLLARHSCACFRRMVSLMAFVSATAHQARPYFRTI